MTNLLTFFNYLRFLRKKPLVTFKIIRGVFRAMILGKPTIRTVDFAVTYDCHYQCGFCSALLLKNKNRKELTKAQIIDTLKQANKLGMAHYQFTGGDPFLRDVDELCGIIKAVGANTHLISIVTSSIFVTKEKLRKLAKAGLDIIQLSLESMNEELNDKARGVRGAFRKTMQALEWSKESGLNICFSIVVMPDNLKEVMGVIDFAKKEGCMVLLSETALTGSWIKKEGMKLKEEHVNMIAKLRKIPHVRIDKDFNFKLGSYCPAGKELIEITAYGDVMPCARMQISYGNVLEEPLWAIHKRMCGMPYLTYKSKICRQALDRKFYDIYLKPLQNEKQLPVEWERLERRISDGSNS